ncbi:hypothetical protein IX84_01530 [Phaeodactylibacter xiamenensis]|uniref:Secretion system C-terminal sorting domain-containing protein n=2 Tax=Phaeodactylibacter xiamenensis TaxID=1524460 RepID=A0A098SC73_9BACT|nr:hypothetical protein IX84_01530 [Phaeodactylibacter xiamenensis]
MNVLNPPRLLNWLAMLLLTTASPLSAQLLLQEGFEVETCVPVTLPCTNGQLIDGNNCMPGWSPWFGRPAIAANASPPQGINAALLDCYVAESNNIPAIFSEGLIAALDVPANAGDEVRLKFSINPSNNYLFANPTIEFFLSSGVQTIPIANPVCLQAPPLVAGAQQIASIPGNTLNPGWQTIEVPCVTVNNAYDQLLVRINIGVSSNDDSNAACVIDDIQLQKEPTFTEPTATITNVTGDLCSGDALSVTYEICSDEDVILNFAPFASPASISVIPPSQSASVSSGMCKTFTFTYNETTELPLGAPITLGLNYTVSYDGSVCDHTSTGTLSQSLEKYCFAEEACLPDGQPFYALSGGNFSALLSEGLLPPVQAATTPQFLYFEGDAVVDFASYTFAQGSILYFDEGVELTVPNGNSLEGLKSEFNGCERMWKGITVEGGGSLSIESSTVSGAQYAVQALHNSTLLIANNVFQDNYIGIYKPNTMTASPEQVNQPLPIAGNTFEGTAAGLLPPYPGQAPAPGTSGLAGIVASNCNLLEVGIGSTPNSNFFREVRNGLITFNTGLRLRGANISDLSGSFNPTTIAFPSAFANFHNLRGHGVFSGLNDNSAALVFIGYSHFEGLTRCTHIENQSGIATVNFALNSSIDTKDGLIVANHSGSTVLKEVFDNNLEFEQYGIAGLNSTGAIPFFVVRSNTLAQLNNNNYPFTVGVLFSNTISPSSSGAVKDNVIGMTDDNGHGVSLTFVDRVEVERNLVAHTGSSTLIKQEGAGIHLSESGDHNNIRENTVTFNMQAERHNTRGIEVLNTAYTYLCCNTTDGHRTGLRFKGACPDTRYRQNDFFDHDTGLRCESDAVTSLQVHPGNEWLGSYGTQKALHLGALSEVLNSLYLVDFSTNPPMTPKNPLPDVSTPNTTQPWIVPDDGFEAGNCEADQVCGETRNPKLSRYDSTAVEGGYLEAGEYGPTRDWRGRRSVYQKLQAHPELLNDNALMTAFWEEAANTPVATVGEMESGTQRLFALDSQAEAQLAESDVQLEEYLLSLAQIDSILNTELSPIDSIAYQAERAELREMLEGALAQRSGWVADWYSSVPAEASGLLNAGGAIATELQAAANEWAVFQILLEMTATTSPAFSGEQWQTLLQIAQQCPDEGGKGVQHARTVLAAYESMAYDDEALCNPEQPFQAPSSGSTTASELRAYPNPVQNSVTLQWQDAAQELSLYRADGQRVAQFNLQATDRFLEADLSTYPKGLYIAVVHLIDGSTQSVKVIK